MKGHTVPWAFLSKEIQAVLAIVLIGFAVKYMYRDPARVRRWGPWLSAVVAVLLAPLLMGWLGFGPQGIQAKTLAAELQSLATGLPWLMQIVSALQSISTKGMGLKTAGVISAAGGAFGRLALLPAYDQLRAMGFIPVPAEDERRQLGPNDQARQAVEQGDQHAQERQQPDPRHAHGD